MIIIKLKIVANECSKIEKCCICYNCKKSWKLLQMNVVKLKNVAYVIIVKKIENNCNKVEKCCICYNCNKVILFN